MHSFPYQSAVAPTPRFGSALDHHYPLLYLELSPLMLPIQPIIVESSDNLLTGSFSRARNRRLFLMDPARRTFQPFHRLLALRALNCAIAKWATRDLRSLGCSHQPVAGELRASRSPSATEYAVVCCGGLTPARQSIAHARANPRTATDRCYLFALSALSRDTSGHQRSWIINSVNGWNAQVRSRLRGSFIVVFSLIAVHGRLGVSASTPVAFRYSAVISAAAELLVTFYRGSVGEY